MLKPLLRITVLAALLVSLGEFAAGVAAETAHSADASLHWEWTGKGHFPQAFSLTIMRLPNGDSWAQLEEWGPLRSVDGWGELQRSYQMNFGSIRQVGDRNFMLLPELHRAAEFTIAADGILHLHWFALATEKPVDADLLSARQSHSLSDLPEAMKPSWFPSPKAKAPSQG
jgi:hypothetical protein